MKSIVYIVIFLLICTLLYFSKIYFNKNYVYYTYYENNKIEKNELKRKLNKEVKEKRKLKDENIRYEDKIIILSLENKRLHNILNEIRKKDEKYNKEIKLKLKLISN